MCRALIIIAIILSFFGSVLVLVGMKCTKVGGSEIANARVTFAGGMNYLIGGETLQLFERCHIEMDCMITLELNVCIVSGICSMVAFSYYGYKIVSEFKDPNYKEQKYVQLAMFKN